MTHSSSSTVPGASDAPSQDGNGPLSLDALFSAELSGGEQQRVAVARALANNVDLALAASRIDEARAAAPCA